MESILIFFITIIVLAYSYLKKNKKQIFKKAKRQGLKIVSVILIAILVFTLLIEEVTQK